MIDITTIILTVVSYRRATGEVEFTQKQIQKDLVLLISPCSRYSVLINILLSVISWNIVTAHVACGFVKAGGRWGWQHQPWTNRASQLTLRVRGLLCVYVCFSILCLKHTYNHEHTHTHLIPLFWVPGKAKEPINHTLIKHYPFSQTHTFFTHLPGKSVWLVWHTMCTCRLITPHKLPSKCVALHLL